MPNKDLNVTPSVDKRLQDLGYQVSDWSAAKKGFSSEIETVLSTSSKSKNNKNGYPDRIYFNKNEKLLILVEEKSNIKDHNLEDETKGAVSGIKWYLSRFLKKELNITHKELINTFDNYKIIGIAVSGNINETYGHLFNCFIIDNKKQHIKEIVRITNFVLEEDFLELFDNRDIDEITKNISQTTKEINNLLRNIDSQKRPVLLSALIICLHKTKDNFNNFNEYYKRLDASSLISNILIKSKDILKKEGIPEEKLNILESELSFLKTDPSLNNEKDNILKQILEKLENDIIPLFNNKVFIKSNYDIIGKFYEEFLKYAGITNVKKGIVLTPRHITTLFTKLIDLKYNDKIVDLCCGTGAFLIAGMNAIIDKINCSQIPNKEELINSVKTKQLLGFEINPTMYTCAISNMLFRGDGKSSIYCLDSIKSKDAEKILKEFKPTIGFINPPYSGKENKENPTPKEITFLQKLLDNCERYAVMIAPLSVYNKESVIRDNILKKHTLKAVINMPRDLFSPSAGTHTAISVFETNRPFDYNIDEVLFYDLRDDGFILNKQKGRIDYYNKWEKIENNLLEILKNGTSDNIKFIKAKINKGDEWNIYAFSETDYSTLSEYDFIKTISNYAIFKAKRDMNILEIDKEEDEEEQESLNEFETIKILISYYGTELFGKNTMNNNKIDISKWKLFKLKDKKYFTIRGSKTTPLYDLKTKYGIGEYSYITTSSKNNGTSGFYDSWTEKENVLTFDSATIGSIFYQDKKFSASDHVEILEINNIKLNKYIALFIITSLNKSKYKYGYGRKRNQTRMKEEKILLPVNSQGEPDWEYMENYIKSLPYGDLI